MVTVETPTMEERSMVLNINCLIGKKRRLFWEIKKTPVGIGILNQRVEE